MAVTGTTNSSMDQVIGRRQHTWLDHLLNSQASWVFIAIVVACIFLTFASTNGAFATPPNLFNITRDSTFAAVIALGATFVIITGGIDLRVGSVLVLCSMVIATTMHAGASIEVGILAAHGTGLLVGLFNGIL